MQRRLRGVLPMRAAILAAALVLPAANARACSVCIAHAYGAAMHGIGAQTIPPGSLVIGFNYLNFEKSNGTDTPGAREHEQFHQTELDINKGLSDRLLLRLSLPTVDKSIKVDGQAAESAHGLGDAVIGFQYQVPPKRNSKFLTAFSFDAKLPTGSNNLKNETGAVRDEHLQPGTGSADVAGGVDFTGEGRRPGDLWFAGLRERINGSNSRHYHYGNVLFYSAGYVHPLSASSAAVLEFNGRVAAKDRTREGGYDPDSGGRLGYASVSYRRNISRSYGLIAACQMPVLKKLNGTQDEKSLFSLSLTRTF